MFFDTTTQTNPTGTVKRTVTLNSTQEANGVSIVSGSQITFAYSGIYNIQFSFQITKSDIGNDVIYIWLAKNGTDLPDTTGAVRLIEQNDYKIAAWNYVYTLNAGDYLEFMWMSDDVNAEIITETPAGGIPRIPSALVTVQQIMYTVAGPTGPTGPSGP